MRLFDFIGSSMEPILQAWENYARSVETELPKQDSIGLRNHAEELLRTVAADMRTPRAGNNSPRKHKGEAPGVPAKPQRRPTRLLA